MSGLTYAELRSAVMQHHRNKTYTEGLDLIAREESRFRQYTGRIAHWRACLYGAAGFPAEALQALQDAVAAGHWYTQGALDLPDLKSIQALPGFEPLQALCQERMTKAQAQAKPFLISNLYASAPQPAPLLLTMHGNFSNATESAPLWEGALAEGWFLGLAQSSQVSGPDVYVWNDWDLAEAEIKAHYGALCENFATDCDRTVLGGFSMGGGLAVWLAVTGALAVKAFVAVGPWIDDVERLAPHLAAARDRGLRGYLFVGDQDNLCLPKAERMAELYAANGVPCELEIHPGLGHEYPATGDWLKRALAFVTNA